MKLSEHFSENEIDRLNKLAQRWKFNRWLYIFLAVGSAVCAVLFFNVCFFQSRSADIHDLYSFFVGSIDSNKTYTHAQVTDIVMLYLYLFIGFFCSYEAVSFLIKAIFSWKKGVLVRCWELLSPMADNTDSTL